MKQNRPQNPNIDFGKFISEDDINERLDVIKGVHNLLGALELSADAGSNPWDRYAFYALQVALEFGIEQIEELKPNIEYMGNFMRYETIKIDRSDKEVTK